MEVTKACWGTGGSITTNLEGNILELHTAKQLEQWLEDNNWLHDAHIFKIMPLSRYNNTPEKVSLIIRYQVKGSYEAGTPKIDNQFTLIATKVRRWTFNQETKYNPDHCVSDIEVFNDNKSMGLRFDIPDQVELSCDEITIIGPEIIKSVTKPWTSKTKLHVELPSLPKPIDWINWLAQFGLDVSWRYGYGEAKLPEKLPYPNYSGWFLQETDKMNSTDFGVLFDFVGVREQKSHISLSKYDKSAESLWIQINKILANQDKVIIKSGNCTFDGYEWKEFLEKCSLPKRYQLID